MNEVLIYAVGSLGAIGVVAAIILYFVAQKFKVYEDPRIDEVEEALPSANCGGCGYAGCRAFAEGLVKAGAMEGFNCPVGGADVMQEVAGILGLVAEAAEPQIAVIRCNGSLANSPKKVEYDGISTCASAHVLYAGDGGCSYGCLGLADCVASCDFDAIHMNPETGLPVVDVNCVACGACVEACPRDIIELRNVGKKERRIFVSCVNEEKGAPAKKNCTVACIGCAKCFNVCAFDAIEMKNNRAYIDYEKCKLCRKCVDVCPTDAIHEINFPVRKLIVKEEKEKAAKVASAAKTTETVSAKTSAAEKKDKVNKTEES
ncbi:MAG: RnfABCDGE type electron transport complex subunit B [Bacteroidales bacterium]|nr:RnfABCDGE type electron transport complex subunit B [Bacteroidales bacterium]